MKKNVVVFLFLFLVLKVFSQNKSHTIFDKDSIVSVTNYINKFKIVDSLVIKSGKRKLVISEKNVIPFYKKYIKKDEELGICPFATDIRFFNKRLIVMSAILRNNFSTSFYIFFINRKTGKTTKIIKTESAKKGLNTLSVIATRNKIFIPKRANFIISDSIKVLNKNSKSIKFINPSSKHLQSLMLGTFKKDSEKETYFYTTIK